MRYQSQKAANQLLHQPDLTWIDFFKKIKKAMKTIFIGNTRPRQMFNLYFYFLLLGTILLMTPLATNQQIWHFLPALFTASSAFSDTGLTVKSTANDFTFFGQLIILLLIKFGGIGLISVKLLILSLFRWGIQGSNLRERLLLQGERGSNKLGSTVGILRVGIITMTITELLGAIALTINFCLVPNNGVDYGLNKAVYYHNFWLSLWAGVFHSVSATNNAGFDIVGPNSLVPFQGNYFVQIVFLIQFIIGGIGFPVFYDLFSWLKARFHHQKFRFSLFTKITTLTYLLVAMVGVALVFMIELLSNRAQTASLWHNMSHGRAIMAIIFNTMSTRNAGFYTVNMTDFHGASQVIQTFMMLIGSSPASTAGGIRTTTFAIIIMSIISIARGRENVNIFKRRIPDRIVKMSFIVSFVGTTLIFITSVIILFENLVNGNNLSMTFGQTLFEAASAFGTTGLSLFDNAELGTVSQISLIILMFVGQLGVSTTILALSDRKRKAIIRRVEENVTIG